MSEGIVIDYHITYNVVVPSSNEIKILVRGT